MRCTAPSATAFPTTTAVRSGSTMLTTTPSCPWTLTQTGSSGSISSRRTDFEPRKGEWHAGLGYMGGSARPAPGEYFEKFLRGINIQTGEIAFDVPQVTTAQTASAGVMSTASGLVFYGENSGSFMAVDAANGKILWQFPTNQVWKASPMTYMFDNKQYVAIAV